MLYPPIYRCSCFRTSHCQLHYCWVMSFLQETNWSRDRFLLQTVTIFYGGTPATSNLLALVGIQRFSCVLNARCMQLLSPKKFVKTTTTKPSSCHNRHWMKFKVQYCYKHPWYLLRCINSWCNVLFQKIPKSLKKLMACLGGFILYTMLIPVQQCGCHDGNVKIELF